MAASAWQKLFPDGRGLLNGNHLNRIFTGAAKVSAMEMGSIIIDGAATFNGGSTVTGQQKVNIATVIATGSSVANARTVGTTASTIVVNATASTEGVKLPTPSTGLEVTVYAPTAVGVLVYASAAGQSIGTGTTNTTGFAVTKNTGTQFLAISKTKWRVLEA